MQYHIFGSSTSTGKAFSRLLAKNSDTSVFAYSRNDSDSYVDFNFPHSFVPRGSSSQPSVWISFAPIWMFASFLKSILEDHPDRLTNVVGLVVCSSSSALTKSYAFNGFDKNLSKILRDSEKLITDICCSSNFSCFIVRPTLIYSNIGSDNDKNISLLLKMLRSLPFLLIPSDSGHRQPIHSTQLAMIFIYYCDLIFNSFAYTRQSDLISVGGDVSLSYYSLLRHIQKSQSVRDPSRNCLLIRLPNRLFFFLVSPVILLSTKLFESILRVSSDLSGFTQVHQILNIPASSFPYYDSELE